MSLEVKKIYFDEQELKIALVNFSNRHKQFLRIEDIREITISETSDPLVTFKVDKSLYIVDDQINYTRSEVAAALLALCMIAKIPMPKAGAKEIFVEENNFILKITLKQDINFETYLITDQISNISYVQ